MDDFEDDLETYEEEEWDGEDDTLTDPTDWEEEEWEEEEWDGEDDTLTDEEDAQGTLDDVSDVVSSPSVSIYDDLLAAGFKFSATSQTIDLKSLLTTKPMIESRRETLGGLKTMLAEMPVIYPIIVTPSLSYLNFLESAGSKEGYSEPKYKLLDGLRRVNAALRNGVTELPGCVIEFDDPELGAENFNTIRLILNRRQQFSWREKWSMFQTLELQSPLAPATLEFLLDIAPGESMKLKDLMMSGYQEIIDSFLEGKKTLQQASSALQKARNEENRSDEDDKRGLSEVDGAEDLVAEQAAQSAALSPEDIKEILGMDTGSDSLEDEDAFGGDADMFSEAAGDHVQDTADREKISPELRSAIFRRDDYTCQCCGFGKGLTSNIHLGILQAHHIVSVYVSGNDSIDNFVTLCVSCHSLVHLLTQFDNKLGMKEEDFHKMPEGDQKRLINCRKYAKYILAAEAKTGKKLAKDKPRQLPGNRPFWVGKAEGDAALNAVPM